MTIYRPQGARLQRYIHARRGRVDATRIHNGNSTLRQSYTQKTAYRWWIMAYFSHSACTAHGTHPWYLRIVQCSVVQCSGAPLGPGARQQFTQWALLAMQALHNSQLPTLTPLSPCLPCNPQLAGSAFEKPSSPAKCTVQQCPLRQINLCKSSVKNFTSSANAE